MLVTGLSLDAYDTLYNLAVVEVAVTLAVLLAAGLGGAALIRLTLRPLRRVAATAGQVAELPLHAGEVVVAERVPEVDTDPRTEVGQVGAAQPAPRPRRRRWSPGRPARRGCGSSSRTRATLRTPLAAIRGTPNWAAGRSPRRPR